MSAAKAKASTARFRPRARLAKILGEHLIRDNTVGLMELVKNSYDADASLVAVELQNVRTPELMTVIVRDDGLGMTEDVLRGPWFEPAHGSKELQKAEGDRTPGGRLPLGEKGVGRFAAQKLGRALELVTRPEASEVEFCVAIDWDAFDQDDRYMDEVEVPIIQRPPEVFTGDAHGTQLTMRAARQPWRRRDVERFQASLIRLISPKSGVEGFRVELVSPEFPELEPLDQYDILDLYQYRIDCIIDERGIADYEYRQRKPDGTEEVVPDEQNLWALMHPDEWTERSPACGPFLVQISAWLLKAALLREYGLTRDQLRVLGGVSIYRDGFRILPYGDEGDDWLSLDQRRINVPAERLGNRQLIGIAEIDQEQNGDLIDKTNREGLQENQAYFDLRALTLGVVQTLERHSLEQRQSVKTPSTSKQELETRVNDLESTIQRMTGATEEAEQPLPGQADGEPGSEQETDQQASPDVPEGMALIPTAELEQLEQQATQVRESVAEVYETQDEERETFLHLLGIGLAAERFAHEFDRMVDRSSTCIQALKLAGTGDEPSLEQLDTIVNALRNEIRLMGSLRYVRRSQRAADQSVRETVELVLMGHDEVLQQARVRLESQLDDDFTVCISQASLAQVVDNIVDNALYWLRQKAELDDRRLRVQLSADDRTITISNSGPGIVPNVRSRLFAAPFVTAKPDGRGLGMYITAEILKRTGGSITLGRADDERLLDGASFVVTLPL